MQEKTLVLIKPDAFEKQHTGDIIAIYEKAGLKILAMKLMQMTPRVAQKHYAEHIGRSYYAELEEFMTSAPLVAMVLAGDDAIRRRPPKERFASFTPKALARTPSTLPTALRARRAKSPFSSARSKSSTDIFLPHDF